MTKIKNKRAILLPEVLKIVVAVLCIIALIYLAVSLYGIFISKSRLQQAKAEMDEITRVIYSLKEGETKKYLLLTPANYILIGWPMETKYEIFRPDICLKNLWKNCICLCKFKGKDIIEEVLGGIRVQPVLDECNREGICKEVKGVDLLVSQDVKYKRYLIEVNLLLKEKKYISISLKNGIYEIKPSD